MRPISVLLSFCLGNVALASDSQFVRDFPFSPTTVFSGFTLTTGIGSAGFHRHTDPAWSVWTITDRGPNADFTGSAGAGKKYPVPGFAPSIYHLSVKHGRVQVLDIIPLIGANGLPNPLTAPSLTEIAYGPDDAVLPPSPNGIDTEGLVRMPDGTFWIAEENAPALLHVAANGQILRRLVPKTVDAMLVGSLMPTEGTLPKIFRLRRSNRGFESIAVSPDSSTLYTALQSPLDHPANSTKPVPKPRDSRTVRLLRVDPVSGAATAEWVYVSDGFASFEDGVSAQQGEVKISELVMVDQNRLFVEERTDWSCRIYSVDLSIPATDILGSEWDDEARRPTLEQVDPVSVGIVPLKKTLVFDQNTDYPDLPNKIESVVIMKPNLLLLINDNDFGVAGDNTTFTWIALPPHATN